MRFSCLTSKFVWVVLVTSMYFGGTGNARHGPEIVYRFTGIRKWVLRLWKRPFCFSKKVNITLSLNWSMPYLNSPSLGNITSFALSLFEWISDASIVSNSSRSAISTSPFQILPAYRAYPRNNPGKTFFPNWWILDWSFAVLEWY